MSGGIPALRRHVYDQVRAAGHGAQSSAARRGGSAKATAWPSTADAAPRRRALPAAARVRLRPLRESAQEQREVRSCPETDGAGADAVVRDSAAHAVPRGGRGGRRGRDAGPEVLRQRGAPADVRPASDAQAAPAPADYTAARGLGLM